MQLTGFQLYLVSSPSAALPFRVEDVSLPIANLEEPDLHHTKVGQTTRFNNRALDLRTPVNQSIFRIHGAVAKQFRVFLDDGGFTGQTERTSCIQ